VVYNVQRTDLPGLSISGTQMYAGPMAEVDFTVPGEKATFDPLNLGIILDEDMRGWEEIFNWMMEAIKAPGKGGPKTQPIKLLTDATLLLNNNKFRSNIAVRFHNLYPTNLGVVSFDYSLAPDTALTFDVTFNYSHFTFERIAATA
jgi:hypothetical protein